MKELRLMVAPSSAAAATLKTLVTHDVMVVVPHEALVGHRFKDITIVSSDRIRAEWPDNAGYSFDEFLDHVRTKLSSIDGKVFFL